MQKKTKRKETKRRERIGRKRVEEGEDEWQLLSWLPGMLYAAWLPGMLYAASLFLLLNPPATGGLGFLN